MNGLFVSRQELVLQRPLPVRGAWLRKREILQIENERGHVVDCAPLPGLHPESIEDCLGALQREIPITWRSMKVADFEFAVPQVETQLSSLRTALEMLAFYSSMPTIKPKSRVYRSSALLSLPERGGELEWLEAIDPRYSVVKVKIGYQDLGWEAELLRELQTRVPGLELRLDANQNLSRYEFEAMAQAFHHLPVAYYEEPCSEQNLLLDLCRDYPIALDESLYSDLAEDLLKAAEVWVIKPNMLGWARTLAYFARAHELQKQLVLSNAFESRRSLQAYAFFYACLVEKQEALGFGTAVYFHEASSGWDPCLPSGPYPLSPYGERV